MEEHQVDGKMLVYVGDLCISAPVEVVEKVIQMLKDEWQTSEPERISQGRIRLLGMEINKVEEDFFATQVLHRGQGDGEGPTFLA